MRLGFIAAKFNEKTYRRISPPMLGRYLHTYGKKIIRQSTNRIWQQNTWVDTYIRQ